MSDRFIEKRFKELSERLGLEKSLPELPKITAWYHPPKGEVPGTPFKLSDFKSKAERDKWYETTGKAIEVTDGGKMEFREEK